MSMKRLAAISAVGSIGIGRNLTSTIGTTITSNNTNTTHATTTNDTNFLFYNISATGGYQPINGGGSSNVGVIGWEKASGSNHYPPHHHYPANMRSTSTNVNLMLGGAMLSVVITMLCFVCYCCHRSIQKRAASASAFQRQQEEPQQRWMNGGGTDGDDLSANNMEIYSVEQCYETAGLFADHLGIHMESSSPQLQRNGPPPPSYDTVLAMDEFIMKAAAATCCHRRQRLLQRGGRPRQLNKNLPCATSSESIDSAAAVPLDDSLKDYTCTGTGDGNNESTSQHRTASYHTPDEIMCCCERYETFLRECGRCGRRRGFPVTTADTSATGMAIAAHTIATATVNNGMRELNGNVICIQDYNRADDEENNNSVEALSSPVAEDYNCVIDLNRNVASTSAASATATLRNVNLDTVDDANGLVRMDMSQIIDRTGLPTYEAALKLEASGYV